VVLLVMVALAVVLVVGENMMVDYDLGMLSIM